MKANMLLILAAVCLTGCILGKGGLLSSNRKEVVTENKIDTLVHIDSSRDRIVVYYPDFSDINLVCEKMPEPSDSSVMFCCAASFTGQCLDEFNHFNIAGDHVSSGTYYRGFKCIPNTGQFIYYNGHWNFIKPMSRDSLEFVAKKKGMAFSQNIIIYNKELQPSFRRLNSRFQYRALCEMDNQLCIIESKDVESYKSFRKHLMDNKVKHAMYLDMGRGWNYSWYREFKDSSAVIIHPYAHQFPTNWIVFRAHLLK